MADKAMLFDGSKCTGCKRCQMACKAARGGAPVVEEGAMVRGGVRPWAADVDGDTLLAVTVTERTEGPKGLQLEYGRKSCMHCRDAACVRVCPTGAMEVDDATGFVRSNADRCVSCGLCQAVCPFDVPRTNAEQRRVVKCDGCAEAVAGGAEPFCTASCAYDALLFGDRSELLEEAQRRVDALKEQGFESACVFGATEQGGLRVIEVLKYGVSGARGEVLADTGSNATVQGAELAGPVSLGVLGVLTVGGIVLLGYGMKQPRR